MMGEGGGRWRMRRRGLGEGGGLRRVVEGGGGGGGGRAQGEIPPGILW